MDNLTTSKLKFESAEDVFESNKKLKSSKIWMRIPQWEKDKWKAEAERLNIKLSQFIRNVMFKYFLESDEK